jgi:hypothetical protein
MPPGHRRSCGYRGLLTDEVYTNAGRDASGNRCKESAVADPATGPLMKHAE